MGLMDGYGIMGDPKVVTGVVVAVISALMLWYLKHSTIGTKLPPVPRVPGLPLVGNLLQLKVKPHVTFMMWAKTYGPIFSIKTGPKTIVVLNNTALCKEAMVTRFPSITTKKISKTVAILTADKHMVDFSDYDEFHKTAKRHLLTSVLGKNAQRRHRIHRDTLTANIVGQLSAHVKDYPLEAISVRGIYVLELFGLTMKQALGKDVDAIYVEEFGATISRKEIMKILITDQMKMVIDEDWRDYFPYLKWVPNKSYERKRDRVVARRDALMESIVKEQRKRLVHGEEVNCYLDYLSSEGITFSEKEKIMLTWETMVETTENTSINFDWAMYELARDPKRQERLYQEIHDLCGSEKIVEENLPKLPYLSAVFHETLRRHSPVSIVPLRYVHEDTELGGYHVPAGCEIALNLYGCNMDEKMWENPEEWNPERFLDKKYDPNDMFKTMAFGGGKRVCTGVLQATLINCTVIGRLVQEFEWRLNDGEEDTVDPLTSWKLKPMLAFIKPRLERGMFALE